MKIINDDLLESNAQYIVHQTNCVSYNAAGLAYDIFHKFPWADIYSSREYTAHQDTPGTIIIKGNGEDQRYVIALFGQYFPGKSRASKDEIDSVIVRKNYFISGLQEIAKIPGLKSVAFPDHIGCGLGGGDWEEYHKWIEKFANFVEPLGVEVILIKLSG